MAKMDLAATLERLAVLDELRYTDADAVISEITGWLDPPAAIPPLAIPETLGVLGSAHRMNIEYDRAQGYLEQGLACADEVLDHVQAGSLHQRQTMVWLNRMDYPAALEENRKAIARHEDGAHRIGVAKAMVDRGIILSYQEHFQWSTDAFLRGLDELPETETKHRATALNGVAYNLIEVGELAAAVRYLQEAEQIKVNPRNDAKLKWVYGTVLSKTGHHREGTKKLWTAVRVLQEIAPIDGALAMIDFAKALIRAGQPNEASQAARMMQDCVGSLHNEAAQAAATELALLGTRGTELTLTILEDVRVRVSQAQSGKA